MQPAIVFSSAGDAPEKFQILAMHVSDPKGDFAVCKNMQTRVLTVWVGLQLPDSIKEQFACLDRAVKCPRIKLHKQYSLRPEYCSWEILFWASYRKDSTIQNTNLPSQRLVLPLLATTAQSQQ